MHTPEVTGGVIAFIVLFPRLAGFAVCKKRLVRRGVNGHPDLAGLPVDTVRMASQFMFTAESVGIVVAE